VIVKEEPALMRSSIVADSSVLIHLSRIGMFHLLRSLYEKLIIPRAVHREVVEEGRGRPGSSEVEDATKSGWINVKGVCDEEAVRTLMETHGLHLGDAEVVRLALEIRAKLVLVDELRIRKVLGNRGVKVRGCMGILVEAAERCLISPNEAECAIEKLVRTGYRVCSKLIRKVRSLLRELARRKPL